MATLVAEATATSSTKLEKCRRRKPNTASYVHFIQGAPASSLSRDVCAWAGSGFTSLPNKNPSSGLDDKGKVGACEWNHLQRVDQFLIRNICYEEKQLKTSRTVTEPQNFKPQFKQNTPSLLETSQHMGPVPPAPNSCEQIPVGGPPCTNPPASPAKAHATAPAVKATMHK